MLYFLLSFFATYAFAQLFCPVSNKLCKAKDVIATASTYIIYLRR